MRRRKPNILGYELIAAILTILQLDSLIPEGVYIRHFIDNELAKQCVAQGFSKQPDLNELVGMLCHTAGHRTFSYWAEWVQSAANLADAPSRNDCRLLSQIGGLEIPLEFSKFSKAAEQRRSKMRPTILTVR